MYNNSDELVFKLNAVESTCAVEFYTVVDTSRSPVHNIPCPLHWVRDSRSKTFICFSEFHASYEAIIRHLVPERRNTSFFTVILKKKRQQFVIG